MYVIYDTAYAYNYSDNYLITLLCLKSVDAPAMRSISTILVWPYLLATNKAVAPSCVEKRESSNYLIAVQSGVLLYWKDKKDPNANGSIEISKSQFKDLFLNKNVANNEKTIRARRIIFFDIN